MSYYLGKIRKEPQNGLPPFCSLLSSNGTLIHTLIQVFSEIFNTFNS